MQVIRIAEDGTVLNRQPVPDDYVLKDGVMRGPAGHLIPGRWYRAPEGARDGGRYDAERATYTPPPPPPREVVEARRIEQAIDEGSRRRQVVLDSMGARSLADFLSITARALASVRREARGRPRAGEGARLDQLETLADEIDAIDTARDMIIAEIRASEDPMNIDVEGSPHWPVSEVPEPAPEDPEPAPQEPTP